MLRREYMDNNKQDEMLINEWISLYKKTLYNDVIPFWMKYSLDESGAINNCLDDTGELISKNRYLWSQGRALWTFSALYNRIEQRKEWLDIADGLFNYLSKNGRDSNGKWMYLLDDSGNVLEKDISIYVDGFVLNGMGEYYKATSNKEAMKIALDTYENVRERLSNPGSYKIAPYAIPKGMKTHGINMIFSSFFYNLGKVLNRQDICDTGYSYAKEILEDFYNSEKDAVLEFVTLDGKYSNTPEGRTCVPGHVIEGMWFLIDIFQQTGDKELVTKCCKLIKRHLELAWDKEYGGLLLAIDIEGKEPIFWNKADYKPWWVHVEALVATLYAYKHTGEEWCLEWHKKVQEYAFNHYPVESGEWTQWLDRYGKKGVSAALPVKDPFHLPRGLICMVEINKAKYRNVVLY